MKLSTRGVAILLLAVAAFLIAAASAFGLWSVRILVGADRSVTHSQEVLTEIEKLADGIQDWGDDGSSTARLAARTAIFQHLDNLRGLADGDPAERQQFDKLKLLLQGWVAQGTNGSEAVQSAGSATP
ncbi:MAG TPA: hypothetical protein VJX67_03955, partial [Blastocatellia bacterium]|nr:hypothetical protein [Blastocatellia bacterium]